jgi:hypothetical protein
MTLNYQQVREQIQQLAENAPIRAQRLAELRAQADELFGEGALKLDELAQKVETIVRNYDPNLRCALPTQDPDGAYMPLDRSAPLPATPQQATVLAADGSQIIPDRHAAVYFGLINVGAIQMQYGATTPPNTITTSQLFYDEELYDLSEANLALRRDLNERAILADLAEKAQSPVITFTDGPMELWGAKDSAGDSEFQENLQAYLRALERLKELDVITAGYVDRPAANLVVRLLEVAMLPADHLEDIKSFYPLRGVQDIDLYRDLLAPGERSSVFAIQSRSAPNYRGGLRLHFFYLNVGRLDHPWPVRVEIPEWVAGSSRMLDNLHATLVHQCQIMGQRAYPYLLHRAHEVAVVTHEEKHQVIQMIAMELQRRGLPFGEVSHKQSTKNLTTRSRYER